MSAEAVSGLAPVSVEGCRAKVLRFRQGLISMSAASW
jgi:hypothetical protein